MAEQVAVPQQKAPTGTPAAPLLYLSSADVGWDGLVAQAFHEPMELEGWMTPALPDISLILFRVRQRINVPILRRIRT